jgi:hypothetical protein
MRYIQQAAGAVELWNGPNYASLGQPLRYRTANLCEKSQSRAKGSYFFPRQLYASKSFLGKDMVHHFSNNPL